MSTILVVAEHIDNKLQNATLSAIGFAQAAAAINGATITGLVLGSGTADVAAEMAQHVQTVIHIDSAEYGDYLAENYAPAVSAVAQEVGAIIIAAASTTTGKDFLPRTAAHLGAGFIADAIGVFAHDGSVAYKRPMWSGNVIAHMASTAPITCVTVRTTNFPLSTGGVSGTVTTRGGCGSSESTTFVAFERVKSDRPALTDASVVVAGGRGLKSGEAFGMIEELADLLGGAVGASRAAVDSGYAPNDWQVGQTGKIVAPKLYIAVAISGAIQHLAGMKGSKTIVAINKDAEAPIYQIADFGLAADAFKVVPELIEKLK